MFKSMATGAVVVAILSTTWTIAPAGTNKGSASVVKATARLDKAPAGKAVVVVRLEIQPDWHLYANPTENAFFDSGKVVVNVKGVNAVIDYPAGKVAVDKTEGKYMVYERTVEIRATIDRPADAVAPIEMTVKLQSCSEKLKLCLPPATVKLAVP